MAQINFPKIVSEMSDGSFAQFKEDSEDYLRYYFCESKEASKELVSEKIGNYLERLEEKAKLRDNYLAETYSSILLKYLQNRVTESNDQKGKRVQNYYRKLKSLNDSIKAEKDEGVLITELEDFTKIFLCLYEAYRKAGKKTVADFQLNVESITNIKELIDFFFEDAPDVSIQNQAPGFVKNIVPKDVLAKVDDFFEKSKELQDDVVNAAASIQLPKINREKKKKNVYEPVHDVLEYYNANDLFNRKRFAGLLMLLMFYRLKDYEVSFE